jgi:DNA-binding response OmpR family regulator
MKIAALFVQPELESPTVAAFAARGLEVSEYSDPAALVRAWHTRSFDAIVVDDGQRIHHWLAALRASVPQQTAIIVRGGGGAPDMSRALLHGADDYATVGEGADRLVQRTLARAHAKADQRKHASLQAGAYSLDAVTRVLASPERHATLTQREFALARVLFESHDRLVTLDRLAAEAGESVGQMAKRAIEQHIYKLRKKCAFVSTEQEQRLQIEAIYGTGYRLRA